MQSLYKQLNPFSSSCTARARLAVSLMKGYITSRLSDNRVPPPTMPLFRDHPIRSTFAMAGSLLAAHVLTGLSSSLNLFHLTQTSVAILAIAALMFLVTMHHRRDAHLLTQTQEEMVLIGGFALFWMASLLAWRGFSSHGSDLSYGSGGGRAGFGSSPCSSDDVYCMVEEYTYF
ncbi:hypothetical protein BD779DRAFT_386240 [Infundibulicybe gibba]|nr:hypothetical protein BD779DRAFT_386240 [Infundibulicybe gibba]